GLLVLGASLGLFVFRKRWPAGLASWLSYLAIVAPVLGFAQSGPQFVADRYSYISCLAWALLMGSALLYRSPTGLVPTQGIPKPILAIAGAIAVILGILTLEQTRIWRNSETLWRHAVAVDPSSPIAHNNLGEALLSRSALDEADEQFQEAGRL